MDHPTALLRSYLCNHKCFINIRVYEGPLSLVLRIILQRIDLWQGLTLEDVVGVGVVKERKTSRHLSVQCISVYHNLEI